MKKIATVIGARPQFIKSFPVTKALKNHFNEIIIHTGQHYDREMSEIFFEELLLKEPHYNLEVKEHSHAMQTGKMMIKLENVFLKEKPELVIIYGDTNTTLAGALTAAKLNIPIAHVESGLRSFDRRMPEEINRIVADRLSEYLFTPTETAVKNLKKEGIKEGVFLIGDVMYDAALYFGRKAEQESEIGNKLNLKPNEYILCTVHRSGNTDNRKNLENITEALVDVEDTVIFPVHPRTRKNMKKWNIIKTLKKKSNIKITNPLGYLDFLWLEKNARMILTDSGGVQKESFFFKIPCVTLRESTEWVETVESGWNVLAGADKEKIKTAIVDLSRKEGEMKDTNIYGKGNAAELLTEILLNKLGKD